MININKCKDVAKNLANQSREKLGEQKLNDFQLYLESQGFKTKTYEDIFSNFYQTSCYHYANSHEARYAQFAEALKDEEVKIIWAFRGGAGSLQVLNEHLKQLD